MNQFKNRSITVFALASLLVVSNFTILSYFAAAQVTFQNDFESGNFNAWSGTYRTTGERTTVTTTAPYAGNYNARYTSNGANSYERSYSYKTIPSTSELYTRGYFNISKSGITQNGDRFYLIMFTVGSTLVAYAGLKQNTNGQLCWHLTVRDGSSYAGAYSTTTSALNVWNCIEMHWKRSSSAGLGELFVNGALVCSLKNRNTAYYGNVNTVRFGLPEIYSCTATTVYLDNAIVASNYIGPEILPVKYNLSINAIGEGSTNPSSGIYQYVSNSNVSIAATPNVAYRLSYWLFNGTNIGDSNPCQINITSNYNLTAIFNPKQAGVAVGICPPSSKPIWQYEAELSVELDHILQFQKVTALNYSKITPLLDRGYDVILNIEFQDTSANLKIITAGKYDQYLINLANAINADGRTIWLRPLHEFNGDWYNWGTLYTGNSIADFIPAWQHIVQIFRENNTPVKFQLNYNANNGKNNPTPFSTFYPGDEWVDMIVITCYNRADTDQYDRPWLSFAQNFDAPYNQVIALTSKPIGVAETSSTSFSGNKTQWILDAFDSIAHDYSRVEQMTWFFVNKTVNGYVRDWNLNTPEEQAAFTQGIGLLREVRPLPTG